MHHFWKQALQNAWENLPSRRTGGARYLCWVKAIFAGLLLLALISSASRLRADSRVDDPATLLPTAPAWSATQNAKLEAFEHDTGIKILVQIHLKSPSDEEDRVDGAYMTALSTKLGLVDRGVLIVYFADDPDWRVWVGNNLVPKFVGRAGTVQQFTESGEMHKVKTIYLNAAKAQADADYKAIHGVKPEGNALRSPEYLGLKTAALIDGLCVKLR